MNYHDPSLAAWLNGAGGQRLAQQSLVDVNQFTALLEQFYGTAGVPMADAASTFDSQNFAPTGSYSGKILSQNVANICNWTNMCSSGDVHTNDTG